MDDTKIVELFHATRTGDIRMSQAIADIARLFLLWGLVMIGATGTLACYFVFADHLPLFLIFLAMLVASIGLTGWGYFVLPETVGDMLENPAGIAAAPHRDSSKPPG
jgi:hypothetical protein